MENPMIQTILGTSAASQTSSKKTEKSGDADAFSRELDKATGGKEQSGKTQTLINDDKQAKREDKKSDARAQEKVEDPETRQLQQKHLAKLNGYLYDIALKNTDTMSLGEKQALRVAEFSSLGLHDLRGMLSERGLNLRDLSFAQLAKVTRDGSRGHVSTQLDQIAQDKEREREFEKLAASGESQPQKDLAKELKSVQQNAEVKAQHQADDVRQNRQVVINQILQHIEVRNLANKTELNLKLNPEYLGDLRIKLTHGKEGIKAEFETTSRTTREVIEENEEELRTKVSDRGIRLNEVSVKLVDAV